MTALFRSALLGATFDLARQRRVLQTVLHGPPGIRALVLGLGTCFCLAWSGGLAYGALVTGEGFVYARKEAGVVWRKARCSVADRGIFQKGETLRGCGQTHWIEGRPFDFRSCPAMATAAALPRLLPRLPPAQVPAGLPALAAATTSGAPGTGCFLPWYAVTTNASSSAAVAAAATVAAFPGVGAADTPVSTPERCAFRLGTGAAWAFEGWEAAYRLYGKHAVGDEVDCFFDESEPRAALSLQAGGASSLAARVAAMEASLAATCALMLCAPCCVGLPCGLYKIAKYVLRSCLR